MKIEIRPDANSHYLSTIDTHGQNVILREVYTGVAIEHENVRLSVAARDDGFEIIITDIQTDEEVCSAGINLQGVFFE